MTYYTLAVMQADNQLFRRLVACAAEQKKARPYEQWVFDRIWDIVTSPGWAAQWEYAEAVGKEDIGSDPGVITDADILAVIQPMDAPPTPEQPIENPPEIVQ